MWKSSARAVTSRLRCHAATTSLHQNGGVSCSRPTALYILEKSALQNSFMIGPYRCISVGPQLLKEENQQSNTPPYYPPPEKKGSKLRSLINVLFGATLVVLGVKAYTTYVPEEGEKIKKYLDEQMPESVMKGLVYIFPDSPSIPAPVISGDETRQNFPKHSGRDEHGNLLPKLRMSSSDTPALPSSSQYEQKEKTEEDLKVEQKLREKAEIQQKVAEKEAKIGAQNAGLELSLTNVMEACELLCTRAMESQQNLVEATRKHMTLMKTAMEDSSNVQEKNIQWQNVAIAFDEREDIAQLLEDDLYNARDMLEKLRHTIAEGRNKAETKKNAALNKANESLNKLNNELNKKQNEVDRVAAEYRVMMKFKDLVEKGKEQFKREVESLMPELSAKMGKGHKLTEEELNVLIAHAHRRIEQLQRQLAQYEASQNQRLQQSLSDQRDEDELITQARVKQEREKMLQEFELMKQRWESEAKVEFEIELRRELARQTGAHSEHLQKVLTLQEDQLVKDFERELHMRLIEERQRFEGELSGWTARLRGIESAVAARAASEAQAKEAQDLWLATVALNGSINYGNEDGKSWDEQLKPLEKDVDTIFLAAKNNPFVSRVLESVPEKALKRGVYTEENLRERFRKVSKVARRVALIDETGGSLVKFFMSYLQLFFVVSSVYATTESDEIDLAEMDAFQLCGHAKYWLDRGDLEQALKFMNQLTGEPRRVAADWIDEARLLLETRMAAHALMAFASSSGLGTIF
ncbi:MICOS complex subunit MIC60-1-like [Mya arenaria]|uniref:MICOS complex subunit MIC60-1-like n=1 Tax=Mya arenaria TaxID=6604 RepID=UPI0022E6CB2C|nr:MICOS complex subunit MIC60-1-like [Mya arenaria]